MTSTLAKLVSELADRIHARSARRFRPRTTLHQEALASSSGEPDAIREALSQLEAKGVIAGHRRSRRSGAVDADIRETTGSCGVEGLAASSPPMDHR